MSDKKRDIDWRNLLTEMLGIIFAVLLALWLEGWREEIELKARADEFLARIHTEVAKNRADIEEAVADNQANIEGLRAAIEAGTIDIQTIAPFLKVSGGSTSNAAWQSAQMTQSIAKMPIETVAELAGLYDTQAYYTDYVSFFFQRYTDLTMAIQDPATARPAAQKFEQHLSITNSMAQQLLARYDAFLDS